MLETPKSAKTPSTVGIPNSCATSAIFENGDCTSFTVSPNLFSRSRANSSACASRSRLINLPDVNFSAMAAECPPAPSVASMYVPSGLMRSHSSTSSNSTGVCGALNLFSSSLATSHCPLNSQILERLIVFFRIRRILQIVQHAGVIHHLEIIEVAEHVHLALHLRRFAQHRGHQHSSLPIQLHRLPVVASSHQKLSLGPVLARYSRQLVLNARPNLHRVNSRRFARGAGDVKLISVLFQGVQKHGGYLQPPLLVYLRRTVAPQLHAPHSTRPPFSVDHTQICGLEWPKCQLSPQIWESVYFALQPRYFVLLLPTFYHF